MQLQRAAQEEILVFDRPPYAAASRQVTPEGIVLKGVKGRMVAVLAARTNFGNNSGAHSPAEMTAFDVERALPATDAGAAPPGSPPLYLRLLALFARAHGLEPDAAKAAALIARHTEVTVHGDRRS